MEIRRDVPVALVAQKEKDGEVGIEASPAAAEPKQHAGKQRAKAEEFWEYIILDKKPHVSVLTEEEQQAVPRHAQNWISAGHKTCVNLSALHDGKVSEAWVHFSYEQKRLFVIGQYYADQNLYLLTAKKEAYAPLLARIPPTMTFNVEASWNDKDMLEVQLRFYTMAGTLVKEWIGCSTTWCMTVRQFVTDDLDYLSSLQKRQCVFVETCDQKPMPRGPSTVQSWCQSLKRVTPAKRPINLLDA